MNELPNRDLLYPHEVQKFLRIGRSTIYKFLDEGTIPGKKIAGLWRIPRAEFVEWFKKQPSSTDLMSA
ncbi:MAG: helix-turn-helix domain-containing protein [Candidatus Sungbacteria bacterium]|uniref:Helix-turn-helix domain-containing protein n=1 Tax=Candidatus Sungiibacteriota bacterium TaxID=2750080 RepID=A0A931SEH9_9BACT|nr:helix-turn-helix domain-containing protein [Candidatus Sungbacteria bacterium]